MQSPVATPRRSLVAGLAVTAALLASLLPFASVSAAVPTVTSVNRVETTPTNANTLHWTVTFSEAVSGVDISDFALAEGGSATGSIASVSAGTTTFTVTVDSVAGDGTLGLNVLAGGITSVSTSQVLATPFTGQVYTIDNTVLAPSTPDLDPASDTGLSNSDNYTSDTTPTFNGTAEANASVQLFDGGSTLIASGTANGLGNWSLTSTTLSVGLHSITAKQIDTAGNGPSAASAALDITIDTNVPTAPSAPDLQAASDTGTSSTDNITNDTTPTFQGTGPISTRIDLYAGTTNVGTTTSDVSGNWQITTTALLGGSYVFTAKAVNLAGTSPTSAGLSVLIETSLTLTISQAVGQGDPTNHLPVNFSVVFSNPVTDFTSSDVTSGGTAPGTRGVTVTGSGATYNVAITGPTNTGTVTISIAAGVAHDAAGNASLAPIVADNTITYDITPGPTVTINQAATQADPTAISPINFTIAFSQAVTGFGADDVVIGGTASGTKAVTITQLSSTTYNAAVSGMTSSGTVIATVAADAAVGTINVHPTQASTSTDNTVTFVLPTKWIVTPSSLTPVPGSTITVNAQLADVNGNAAPGAGIVVTWSSTNGGTFSATTSTTNTAGVATINFTVSTVVGTIHTVTATGNSLTGTSANIVVTNNPAVISVSSSLLATTYRQSVTLTVQFASNGANRAVALQRLSPVDATWVTFANLTTNAFGTATTTYAPPYNTQFRASFAGAADLGAGTSPAVRVLVRQKLTFAAGGTSKGYANGTRVSYTATVRPIAPSGPQRVTFLIYKRVNGVWTFRTSATIQVNAAGQATFSYRWTHGQMYIRARANATRYNAATLSPIAKVTIP